MLCSRQQTVALAGQGQRSTPLAAAWQTSRRPSKIDFGEQTRVVGFILQCLNRASSSDQWRRRFGSAILGIPTFSPALKRLSARRTRMGAADRRHVAEQRGHSASRYPKIGTTHARRMSRSLVDRNLKCHDRDSDGAALRSTKWSQGHSMVTASAQEPKFMVNASIQDCDDARC